MSLHALHPNFIDGFASECVRMGLSQELTEHFYKHAVFRQQVQHGKFAGGFMQELSKHAVAGANHWMGTVGQSIGNWLGRGTSRIAPLVSSTATLGSKALDLASRYPKTSLGLGLGTGYALNKGVVQPWLQERSNEEMFTRPTALSQFLPGGAQGSAAPTAAAPSDPWNLIEGLNQTQPLAGSGGGTAPNFHAAYGDVLQKLQSAKTNGDYASQVELMKQKAMLDSTRSQLGNMRQYASGKLPALRDQTQQAIDEWSQQQRGERGNWWQFWQHKWTPQELDVMTSKVKALQGNQLMANSQLQG